MPWLVLAVLDLVGAVLARRYADHRSVLALVGGCLVFGLLFWVYGKSLAYAELATVTFGWIVMIQVGVMLLERFQRGQRDPARPDRGHGCDRGAAGLPDPRALNASHMRECAAAVHGWMWVRFV